MPHLSTDSPISVNKYSGVPWILGQNLNVWLVTVLKTLYDTYKFIPDFELLNSGFCKKGVSFGKSSAFFALTNVILKEFH